MNRVTRWTFAAMTAAFLLPATAAAQEDGEGREGRERVLGDFGLGIEYGRATGAFSNYVRDGIGLNGWLTGWLGRGSPFGIRLGGHVLIYGTDTRRYPLLPGIDVDVTTNNTIAGLVVGPEFRAGEGAVRAYAFGGIGFNYFATTSNVSGSDNTNSFASSTNFDDFTFAGEAGGGVRLRLSRKVALDFGARYVRNGEVTYVTKERISVSGSQLVVNPITSDANLVIYHLGVSIALTERPADRTKH